MDWGLARTSHPYRDKLANTCADYARIASLAMNVVELEHAHHMFEKMSQGGAGC